MELSQELKEVLLSARARARALRHAYVDCEHVLEGLLLRMGETRAVDCVADAVEAIPRLPFEHAIPEFSRSLNGRAIPAAAVVAGDNGWTETQCEHLLLVLLSSDSPIRESLRAQVLRCLRQPLATARRPIARTGDAKKAVSVQGLAEPRNQEGPSPWLHPVQLDKDVATLVERPEILDRLMQTLLFGNPLLVGPPGSGRRSLVGLLAARLNSGAVPPAMAGLEMLELDPVQLLAGTTYRGEFEERLTKLLAELVSRPKRAILVVRDLHSLLGAAGPGGVDVGSALVSPLRRRDFRIIGTTTRDLLRERLEKHPAFLEHLVPVAVDPPDAREAVRLLAQQPQVLEADYGVRTSVQLLERSVELCQQHLPHLALPGVAERVLRDAAATLSFETAMLARDPGRGNSPYWQRVGGMSADGAPLIGERHLLHTLSQVHRIPFEHLDSGVDEKIRGLASAFHAEIFGQDHVLDDVQKILKVALMNLADPKRPRGRMFFLGPPGTGKTECARLLSRYLMGSESALLRYDMSEFQSESSVSTLIGSDKGLVGSDEGGRLTEPLLENPHRVVLFDEIEKAHPAVFHLLLPILDFGETRDKRGRLVSFRHTICIFTSNAGCSAMEGLFGSSRAEITARLGGIFRPEFLDRIEHFVAFRALDAAARRRIAQSQLESLRRQLERTHHVGLAWTAEVVECAGRMPVSESGARNILRWVQGEVKPAIVDALLDRHAVTGSAAAQTMGAATRCDGAATSECAHPGEIMLTLDEHDVPIARLQARPAAMDAKGEDNLEGRSISGEQKPCSASSAVG